MEFMIRDEDGKIYNKVSNPAALVDVQLGCLLYIGNEDYVELTYNTAVEKYKKAGLEDLAADLKIIKLPLNQEEIDKVFQISNYVKKYI